MRSFLLLLILAIALKAGSGSAATALWQDLQHRREALPGFHQEFEVSHKLKAGNRERSAKRQVVVDFSQREWREQLTFGAGNHIKVFDGTSVFDMEEGGDEYVLTKPKKGEPIPVPYAFGDADWKKAIEVERRSCGFVNGDHECVVIDVPLKPSLQSGDESTIGRMIGGSARLMLETKTGVLIACRTVEAFQTGGIGYQSDVTYVLKRMTYGSPRDGNVFKPSQGMHQVKELHLWDASKLNAQLAGKPAPDFAVTDLQGKSLTLADFKGKTVLLDFWTTWCGPCQVDAPALDKLFRKYGGKELMIIGISVSEDRKVVEKFLESHPRSYPVVLTSENEIPRPYQIRSFPTYIVIDGDKTVISASEGTQALGELRKLLRKAGMDVKKAIR